MLAVILSILLVAVAPHALAQVLWRAPVEDSERAIAANDGRVFALQGQRLVVFDRETGRLLWRSRHEARPPVQAGQDYVVAENQEGQLVAWVAASGRVLWTGARTFQQISSLAIAENTLLVLTWRRDENILWAYDLRTGRELWQSEAPRGGSQKIQGVIGSTVIWALTVSGAYTTTRYLGLDLHTGKKRWDTLADDAFLGASGTTLHIVALGGAMPMSPRLIAVNLKTGQIKRKPYSLSSRVGCEPVVGANRGVTFYRGRYWLMVQDRCGRHLVGIRFNDMEADISIDVPDNVIVADVAPDGFLLLRSGVWDSAQKGAANLGLVGIELSSGRKIHYHANGISTKTRVWVLSNIYVGRPDGQLAVFDRNSGKRLSSFQAGDGPIYSVTAAGGMLLVHSGGELLAFRRPGG